MSHIIPQNLHVVDQATGLAARPWYYFFEHIGRVLFEASQVAQVTTANVSASSVTVTAITALDAVDPATTMALVNVCKAKINEIITALGTPTAAETAQAALINELKAKINELTTTIGQH